MNISDLTTLESTRQKSTLNLIASENYPSPQVLSLLGSVWSNKYGEGYPGKRYYAGNQNTDQLETFTGQKALEVFGAQDSYGVNLQVLSGSPANAMVFLSVLNYGDKILSLNIANGGHISHLHATSNWNKFFKLVNYDVKEVAKDTFEIDLEDFEQKVIDEQPKLVIIGFSAYPRTYEFEKMCQIAHQNGSIVLADVAHINGLIAAGVHASPFAAGDNGADFVTMTTHKTFRGPRGAMLFGRNNIPDSISGHFKDLPKGVNSLIGLVNKTVFPGTSGGPHFNKIAAIARACQEILGEEKYPNGIDFVTYSKKTLENVKALEKGLISAGLTVISPSQNHLCLIKLPDELDSLEVQQKLESAGIITNRNGIPFDTKSPWRPSGMRFGMAALTSRGISEEQSVELGKLIGDLIFDRVDVETATKQSLALAGKLDWWY